MKSVFTSVVAILVIIGACSTLTPKTDNTPSDPGGCGDLSLGQTKKETCEGGEKVFVCRSDGLEEILNTCKATAPTECVSFDDIKPILTDNCLVCHFTPSPYDRYDVAKGKIDSFIRRQNLGADNPERMPKEPRPPLSAEDKRLIERWKADGLKETDSDCNDTGPVTGSLDLFQLESAIILDLAKLEADDRINTRYVVTSHREGDRSGAVDKTLSSLSSEEELYKAEQVAPGLYRFDLRSYGLDSTDWRLVEDVDPFDLESFTDEGEQIKFLTGARKAWFHFDNFIDITQTDRVYYALLDSPKTINQLLIDIGVNVGAQFRDFSAQFLGFNGSEISLQKNRLIVRFDSEDGYAWVTFDPIALDGVRERNLFEFPCLNGTGCQALFEFAAGEVIYTLPNGMQAYFLFNAAGERQDNAAIELGIVQDTRSPVDPEIQVGIDCHRCHAKGILPSNDEIRDHVTQNGSLFNAEDRQIILELYKSKEANNAAFTADNAVFSRSLAALGIDPNIDQINKARDDLRLDWDLSEVASFLFLSEEEFIRGLKGSAQGSQAIGQLITGGRITFDQFLDIIDVLKNDLRLFQEPL